MQTKILKLFVTFIVLFSLKGFSQTTEKSKHPLLDKYYPQKQNDTSTTVTTQTKPIPVVTNTSAINKAANTTVPLSATKLISETKPASAVTDTTAINKPANTIVPVPVQKVKISPAAIPYNLNRLGSSTPAYDTWEKNNNGAGSVTTSPK